mgnify:CR=1 FL=1
MTYHRFLTLSALVAGLAFSGSLALAETATHDHQAGGSLTLTLNAGAKWQGDDNMLKGMSRIREAIATRLPAIHGRTLTPADSKLLASDIQGQVDFMVQNCKLKPEVDAQFHIVLAEVMDGISELEGETEPHRGAIKIAQALNAYGTHFEHPNWQPLE